MILDSSYLAIPQDICLSCVHEKEDETSKYVSVHEWLLLLDLSHSIDMNICLDKRFINDHFYVWGR